jgi:hypothetical protein
MVEIATCLILCYREITPRSDILGVLRVRAPRCGNQIPVVDFCRMAIEGKLEEPNVVTEIDPVDAPESSINVSKEWELSVSSVFQVETTAGQPAKPGSSDSFWRALLTAIPAYLFGIIEVVMPLTARIVPSLCVNRPFVFFGSVLLAPFAVCSIVAWRVPKARKTIAGMIAGMLIALALIIIAAIIINHQLQQWSGAPGDD